MMSLVQDLMQKTIKEVDKQIGGTIKIYHEYDFFQSEPYRTIPMRGL